MADKLTQKIIDKLKHPAAGNRILYDSEIPGFGVRITSAGVLSFILNYRVHGRERRCTIGRYPELTATAARERALQLRGRILDGHDPLEERKQDRTQPTLGELATEYLERYAEKNKRPSSVRNDKAMIDGIVRPRLGALRLKAVGSRDIEALHASLKTTPYQANRVLALLSKMFSLAIEWGWTAENPAKGVQRFHEDRRERWLSTEELQRFTAALDAYKDQDAANALRLLLLTGARAGEVLKATWSEIDLERGVWTKPSHHTKQKKIEHIPLSPPALELLKAMKPRGATGPLFIGRDGSKARVSLKRPWIQACKAAGLTVEITKEGKRLTKEGKHKLLTRYKPTIRKHDLRHSYASHLVSNGVSLQIVGKLLGHTQPQTTQRYAHLSDAALRDATNQFGEIFSAAVAKDSDKGSEPGEKK
jgi:integrase